MKWKDHYKTLNIPFNSSPLEIKKAYRQLAHKYHPDKNTKQDKKTAEHLFREITQSYKVLTNPLLKKEYDETYKKYYKKIPKVSSKATYKNTKEPVQKSKAHKQSNLHDFIKKTVFKESQEEDTLTATFKRQVHKTQKKGRDLKYQLNLSFEDVCDGCEKTITFIRKRNGANKSAKLKIKIPVGVARGKQIKLKGEGDEGSRGSFGDLLVVVNVLPHELFKKKGADVFLDLPITYGQAVMGGKILIPTLRGTAYVSIPSATKSGTVLCLKGEGFKSMDQSLGHLFVNIHIDIPKHLSPISKLKLVEFDKTLHRPVPEAFQKLLKHRSSQF